MIKIELIDVKQAVKRNFSLKILSDVIKNRMKIKNTFKRNFCSTYNLISRFRPKTFRLNLFHGPKKV